MGAYSVGASSHPGEPGDRISLPWAMPVPTARQAGNQELVKSFALVILFAFKAVTLYPRLDPSATKPHLYRTMDIVARRVQWPGKFEVHRY